MNHRSWNGEAPVLADTSAWTASRRDPETQAGFDAAQVRGDVWWCWPVRHELMYAARSAADLATLDAMLDQLREVHVERSVQRGVLALMRELGASSSHGAHRYPLTDLTVAVAAQSAGIGVLHHDQHLERLADRLGVPAYWI